MARARGDFRGGDEQFLLLGFALSKCHALSDNLSGHPVTAFSDFFNGLLDALSDRELEVFRMLGQGKGTREIAQEMNVALPTINSFKNRINEKLNFKNSTEMILYALQWFRKEPPTSPLRCPVGRR